MFPLKRMCPRWKHAAGNLKFHIARYLAEHEMSLTKLFWMDKNYSESKWNSIGEKHQALFKMNHNNYILWVQIQKIGEFHFIFSFKTN